jgi:hypothetical protein
MPANSFVVNGKDFTALQTGLTAIGVGSPDWYSVGLFATTGLNAYITFGSRTSSEEQGKPETLKFGTSEPSKETNQRIVTIAILAYTATQGIYSLHHSAINYERIGFDGDSPSPSYWKSLCRPTTSADWVNEDHSIGLNGFTTPLTPDELPFAETPARTQHISLRETKTGGGADLRWYNLRTLISDLKANLVADTSFLDDLGDAVGGYIDWNDDWNSSVSHTGIDFSGSTSAKGTGLSGGNTDHDDSYWHEAGLITSPFTDTKNYVTSGTVRAGEFALEGSPTTNKWTSAIFNVSATFDVSFTGSGTCSLSLGGGTGYDFTAIYFNGIAGVDITNWTTKGGLTGSTIQEIAIEDAQPSDKILVIRSA